jgi:hypothetical protein
MQDPQMPISCISNMTGRRLLDEWAGEVCRAAEQLGRPLTNSKYYGRWMWDAGFVDIVKRHFYWPLDTRLPHIEQRLIGKWAQRNLLDGVEAMSMALLTRGLKWTSDQVEAFLAGVRDELTDGTTHCYVDV